jgi:hypothetical protein
VSSSPFLSLFSPVSLFFSQGVQEALGGKRRGSTLSKRATWRKQSVGGSEVTLHLAQRRNRLRSMIDSRHMTEFIKAHPVDDNSVKSVTLRRRPSVATKQLMETNSTTGKEKWKMPNMATTQNVTCELVAKIALRSAHRSSMARAGTLPMVHAPYTAQTGSAGRRLSARDILVHSSHPLSLRVAPLQSNKGNRGMAGGQGNSTRTMTLTLHNVFWTTRNKSRHRFKQSSDGLEKRVCCEVYLNGVQMSTTGALPPSAHPIFVDQEIYLPLEDGFNKSKLEIVLIELSPDHTHRVVGCLVWSGHDMVQNCAKSSGRVYHNMVAPPLIASVEEETDGLIVRTFSTMRHAQDEGGAGTGKGPKGGLLKTLVGDDPDHLNPHVYHLALTCALQEYVFGESSTAIATIFSVLDENGNGSISKNELKEVLRKSDTVSAIIELCRPLRRLLDIKSWEDTFDEMDTDHDVRLSL